MGVMGDIIYDIREGTGMFQKVLCKGICNCSTMSRMEWEGSDSSKWVIDALLQRLGKSQDNFWSILHVNEFRIMERRRLIFDNLIRENYIEARGMIGEYETSLGLANKNLHMQYIQQAKAFVKGKGEGNWIEGTGKRSRESGVFTGRSSGV